MATTRKRDIYQQTPADAAAAAGRNDNFELLQNYLTSAEFKERFDSFPLHRAVRAGNLQLIVQLLTAENVNQFDYFGKTPMYYATIFGAVKTAEYLCEHGGRINNIDAFNQPALLLAIYN